MEADTTDVILTHGSVYDDLEIETAWKRYKTILVSDAGGCTERRFQAQWAGHTLRRD